MIGLIKRIGSFLNFRHRLYNKVLLKYKKVSFENYPTIRGSLSIRGKGSIKFGKDIVINSSQHANPIGGDNRTTLVVASGASLEIGDCTGISNSTIVCHSHISIGKYVKIGGNVKIYDTDFHSLDFEKRKNKLTDKPVSRPIELGDSCFIGAHSIILKGVKVGKRSIIGAGSIVTKSVPEGEIWGGNPAKFIKTV